MKWNASRTALAQGSRTTAWVVFLVMLAACSSMGIAQSVELTVDYNTFKDPPAQFRGHAWLDFNVGNLSEEIAKGLVDRAVQSDSYGGFMITAGGGAPGGGGRRGATTIAATRGAATGPACLLIYPLPVIREREG